MFATSRGRLRATNRHLSGSAAVDLNFPKAFGDGNWRNKMAADIEKTVKDLNSYSVLEIAKLVKKLEEDWGVSAAAPVAVAAAPAAGVPAVAAAAEEKVTFDVILKEMGANKIGDIKEIPGPGTSLES